jgi:hypothetical protein
VPGFLTNHGVSRNGGETLQKLMRIQLFARQYTGEHFKMRKAADCDKPLQ